MDILLPIQRPYTDLIFKGFKPFEFRTRIPQNLLLGDTIYIYESKAKGGTGKVIGHAKLKGILPISKEDPVSFLTTAYTETITHLGTHCNISCDEWGRRVGFTNRWGVCVWNYAIQLTEIQLYAIPKELHEFQGAKGPLMRAPQSFCYISQVNRKVDLLWNKP